MTNEHLDVGPATHSGEKQQLIYDLFDWHGGLWDRDRILLKMAEELGELVQAFRKKTRDDQVAEVGDLGFSLYALCVRERISFDLAVNAACRKHQQAMREAAGGSPAPDLRRTLLEIGALHPAWSADPNAHLVRIFNEVTARAREAVGAVGVDPDVRADWCARELEAGGLTDPPSPPSPAGGRA